MYVLKMRSATTKPRSLEMQTLICVHCDILPWKSLSRNHPEKSPHGRNDHSSRLQHCHSTRGRLPTHQRCSYAPSLCHPKFLSHIAILHHTTGWWPIVFWTITMARTQYLHPLKIHICIPTTYGLGNKMQISRQTSQWYAMAFFGTYPKNPQGPSNGRLWTCIAGMYRSSK